ncbi:MAG: hypothetical protein JW807_10205 [Spirochaetes bacterium]|nr:hypothetical protein [Spirochaetota bacterium]
MALTRKKYVLDKKFQLKISLRAVLLPLITTLVLFGVLLYFAGSTNRLIDDNNRDIDAIIGTQDDMVDMFLSTPALQASENPLVQTGVATFKKNIGMLKNITQNSRLIQKNSSIVFYILIGMTVVQTAIIFLQFIFFSHKISGPIHVMTNYLKECRDGKSPDFRPLRKNDELRDFYQDFCETLSRLSKK